jgi:hypothetical protein
MIGTAFVVLVVALVVGALIYTAQPQPYDRMVRGFRVRGAPPPSHTSQDEMKLFGFIDLHLASVLSAKNWQKVHDRVEYEWVDEIKTAKMPDGRLPPPDGRKVAGTVVRRPSGWPPWRRVFVVLLLRTQKDGTPWARIGDTPAGHETFLHAVPWCLGQGDNYDHKNEVAAGNFASLDKAAKP